jgi:hypothetical protein
LRRSILVSRRTENLALVQLHMKFMSGWVRCLGRKT